MATTFRTTVGLPPHVAAKIQLYAKGLNTNAADYVTRIAIDWFARGCPPVSAEEEQLRKAATPPSAKRAS